MSCVFFDSFQDEDAAMQLVDLGYRTGDHMKREEFDARKKEIEDKKNNTQSKQPKVMPLVFSNGVV